MGQGLTFDSWSGADHGGQPRPPLTAIFAGLQVRLSGELKKHRQALTHPMARGEAGEEEWIKPRQAHLLHRYQSARVFVIDARGGFTVQQGWFGI